MLLTFILLVVNGYDINAQYLYEFGIGGGISGYTGELSNTPFTSPGYTLGAFYRSNLNSRFSVSLGLDYGKVRGHTDNVNCSYPLAQDVCDFGIEQRYVNMDVQLEVNFFPYPYNKSVLNSSNITPYYFFGVGLVNYKPWQGVSNDEMNPGSQEANTGSTLGIPFGVGIRWMFNEQLGLQLRFKAVKLFTDSFDNIYLNDPFELGANGLQLQRQDWVYNTTIMLTYSFGEDIWDCNCPGGYKRKSRRR